MYLPESIRSMHWRARQAVGDDLVDSVVGDNIPILTEEEKFNEAVSRRQARVGAPARCARRAAMCVLHVAPALRCLLACMGR